LRDIHRLRSLKVDQPTHIRRTQRRVRIVKKSHKSQDTNVYLVDSTEQLSVGAAPPSTGMPVLCYWYRFFNMSVRILNVLKLNIITRNPD
jgi:hypothetical protein